MVKMSISDFVNFCLARDDPMVYRYATVNQKDNNDYIKAVAVFNKLDYSLSPNRLVFSNKEDSLCMSRVNYIGVHDKKPGIGTIADVVCGSKSSGDQKTFKMILENRSKQ